jgi:hypothetical protein
MDVTSASMTNVDPMKLAAARAETTMALVTE